MKKTSFFVLCLLIGAVSFSQELIRLQPCHNPSIQSQADSIKHLVAKDGFSLLREASITMESDYETPTIVPLQQGGLYHFVFIGDVGSKLLEVRMYDADEHMILYQKKAGSEGNIIAFSHVPEATLVYMFNSLQINKKKKKGLCGYVLLFKKTNP